MSVKTRLWAWYVASLVLWLGVYFLLGRVVVLIAIFVTTPLLWWWMWRHREALRGTAHSKGNKRGDAARR